MIIITDEQRGKEIQSRTRGEKRKWQEERREEGAKGKISPCNDHGVEPQKPQSVAKEKST